MNKDLDLIESDSDLESNSDSSSNLDYTYNDNQDLDTLVSSMTYEQAGKPWTESDDEKLKELYTNKKLDIIRIANLFKRGPNSIMCRLLMFGIIKDHIEAKGYSYYVLNKSKFKVDREKKKKGRKPKVKNQIDLMLEQSVKPSQQSQTIKSSQTDLITELLNLNEDFDKKINAIKSEFNLGIMKIISKYANTNSTDPSTEIINIGLKKYILKNNKVHNIVTGSLYGVYDANSNKCIKL